MLDSLQTTKRANYWLIGVTLPLVALGVMFEQWYAFLIPPALFLVWLTLYRLDWAMWFVVLATPLSVTLEDLTGGSGLSVPTEPMLVLITFITLVKMFFFAEYDKRILRHHVQLGQEANQYTSPIVLTRPNINNTNLSTRQLKAKQAEHHNC